MSSAALMFGCAENELDTLVQGDAQLGKGISFVVNENPQTKAQWDIENNMLNMFWYAEQDKMDIYVKNAQINNGGNVSDWNASKIAVYKATRSEGKGYFTATADNQIITPTKTGTKWNAPEFIYVWPTGTTVTVEGSSTKEVVAELPVINAQDQTDVKGSSIVKYSFMAGTKKVDAATIQDYTSGSDMLVDLSLTRTMPLLGFYLKGYDKTTFGKLKSIKLESLGEIKDDGTANASKKSILDYGSDAKWNITKGTYTKGESATANSITLNINGGTTGLEWGNGTDYMAYMTVAPVDRKDMKNGESMKVTYAFENITVLNTIKVTQSWETGHHFYVTAVSGNEGFDLQATPYLMFNNNTLQLNESFTGGLSSIVKLDANDSQYKIDGTNVSSIDKIVANVNLTKADFDLIGEKFSALTELVLNENTEIPAFNMGASSAAITKLTAPKVTTIDQKAFYKTDNMNVDLTDCILPSYTYSNAVVANALLESDKLVNVDLSSVSTIAPEFPAIGIAFTGFNNLASVVLKDGVKLGAKAFSGCQNLATITFANDVKGSVEFTGSYALSETAIESIRTSSTVIPDGTFNQITELEEVLDANGDPIVPTSIGASAFAGTAIVNIDLTQAETIGASAFKGCTALKGKLVEASGVYALYVSKVTEVATSIFEGCTNLEYVSFPAATKVYNDILKDCSKITQIEFQQPITAGVSGGSSLSADTFGGNTYTVQNTTLFVNGGQTGVSGSDLTLGGTTFKFKSIK